MYLRGNSKATDDRGHDDDDDDDDDNDDDFKSFLCTL